jgi:hypothetical protein
LNIVRDMDQRPSPLMDRRTSASAGRALKIYTLYIHDDRYSVPSLDAVSVSDDELAQEAARARLNASPHYHAIEIWEDDRFVGKIERA